MFSKQPVAGLLRDNVLQAACSWTTEVICGGQPAAGLLGSDCARYGNGQTEPVYREGARPGPPA
jgi:hypothetical protein